MLKIDYYAYTNGLARVHPAEKAGAAAVMAVFCLVSQSALTHLAAMALSAYLAVAKGRVPFSFYLKMLCLPAAFLAAGLVAVAFSVTADPQGLLWGWPCGGRYWGISEAGTRTALSLFFKCLGTVSALYFLALTTPCQDILNLLARAGVPALVVEITGLTYRYIFVLVQAASEIYQSQSARLGYSGLKNSFFSTAQLVSVLFGKSFARAQELYCGLLARGYSGDLGVIGEEPGDRKPVRWQRVIGLAGVLLACSVLPQVLMLWALRVNFPAGLGGALP